MLLHLVWGVWMLSWMALIAGKIRFQLWAPSRLHESSLNAGMIANIFDNWMHWSSIQRSLQGRLDAVVHLYWIQSWWEFDTHFSRWTSEIKKLSICDEYGRSRNERAPVPSRRLRCENDKEKCRWRSSFYLFAETSPNVQNSDNPSVTRLRFECTSVFVCISWWR